MYAGDIYEQIRRLGRFTVTDQHLELLKNMYVTWDHCEFGAPQIDPKRPYGNSDVPEDMCEILGYPVPEDDADDYLEVYMTHLHAQMGVVLQIVLSTGTVETGTYESDTYGMKWRRVD